ncbi:cellulose-binding domain-containing protein [Microbispora sp. ATCC PTA-5024]|uniref:cellulose-binding domain-containing protein n=1 Tax=Microbispora sp. ATCC PTA-5024 TaxID=316330 RepID=UPI0003DB727D|nr:cellulose-binding domain-containing protein [Microbispora sp. ATCC PTA-5024]ETK31596.1 hypothetical protein MPTA5024_33875 [Microbispora sp. ATCC PTA-5024]
MRRAWLGACAGVVLAAVTVLIPAAGGAAADPSPTPAPSPTTAWPCNTGPTRPSDPPNDPPTAPGTPEVVSVMMIEARLRWAAATDPDGIACYYVYEALPNGQSTLRATFQPAVTEGTVYLPWPSYSVRYEDHSLYVVAVDSRGMSGARSGSVTVRVYNDVIIPSSPPPSSPPPPPPLACHVTYGSTTWNGGMSTWIEIANTGTTAISGWRLTFTFPSGGQHVTTGWSAQWTQNGAQVMASNMPWNADIAPHRSVSVGFNGSNTGTNPAPAAFYVNGTACT